MSSISRISKAVAELANTSRFGDAEEMRNKDVDIFLPEDISDSLRRMAQIATALFLRCFNKGKIRIHTQTQDQSLRNLLESEAKKMSAIQRLDFDPCESGSSRLAIGCQIEGAVSVDVSGWTARINGLFSKRVLPAAPALAFAVACAVAKIFNRIVLSASEHSSEQWDFCLLRMLVGQHEPVAHEPVNFGRIGVLGAGALGSALGYTISISDWSGQIDIIDYDFFEEPNLETCIAANREDVNRPLRKALSLSQTISGNRIVAKERLCHVKEAEALLNEKWDVFVCAVDNPETRLILDDVNTDLLVNAGLGNTKQDAGWVLWTQHRNGDRLLSELYKEAIEDNEIDGHVPEEFRDECSHKTYQGVSLALPFVGLVGGSLLAASIYRNAQKIQTKKSFLQIDLFRKQQKLTMQ
jgi:hypothetical protein